MKPYAKNFKGKITSHTCHGSNCSICRLSYEKDLRRAPLKVNMSDWRFVKADPRGLAKADLRNEIAVTFAIVEDDKFDAEMQKINDEHLEVCGECRDYETQDHDEFVEWFNETTIMNLKQHFKKVG
jgi:hypothetical protein